MQDVVISKSGEAGGEKGLSHSGGISTVSGMSKKLRLDVVVHDRELAESRVKAQALIMAGRVRVNGQVVSKASASVSPEDLVEVEEGERYVSRGGHKLEGALTHFNIFPVGWRALDIGSSTGGFSDCLLQHGADSVVAVDVGRGQLHWKLRQDPRVTVYEQRNAREIAPGEFGPPFDMVVMDVSFISQKLLWPRIAEQLCQGGVAVALIKPQFEAGRKEVEKGGIVRSQEIRDRVVAEIEAFVADEIKMQVLGVIRSPIEGRDGNVEYLICARR